MAETVSSAELFNYAPKSRFSSFDISLPEGIVPEAMASDIVSGKTDINNFKNNIVSSADLFKSDSVVSSADLFKNTPDKISSPKFEEMPFKGKYPNTYAALKTVSDMIPYAEYLDPDERDAFMKLSTQGQTNKLLKNTLDTELMVAFPKLLEGVGNVVAPAMQRFFPKTYKFWTQERGLGKTNIPNDQPITQPAPTTPEVISTKELLGNEAEVPIPEVKPLEIVQPEATSGGKQIEPLTPLTDKLVKSVEAHHEGSLESKLPPPLNDAKSGEYFLSDPKNYESPESYIKGINKSLKNAQTGQPITATVYHGTPDARFLPEFDATKKGYYKNIPDAIADNTQFIELHGGINQGFKNKSVTGNIGVSLTDNRRTAQSYANKPAFDNQNSVPMVVERYADLKNPKVIDLKGKEWQHTVGKDIDQAIAEGHDGLILKNIKDDYHPSDSKTPSNNVIVFDSANLKTKSQLTSIWNKAQEGKGIEQVTPKNVDIFAEKTPKIVTEPLKTEGKAAKAALDINKTIAEKGFDELPPEELARYNPITKKETIQKVSDLLTTDKEKAFNMAKGNEPIPNDIHPQVLFNAVKNEATAKGDVQTLMDLAKSPIAEERSIAAQKLGASGFNNVADDVVSKIRDVQKAREAAIKSPKIAETVKTKLKAEVNKINLTKDDLSWERFLSKIEC